MAGRIGKEGAQTAVKSPPLLAAFAELFFPQSCVLCGRENPFVLCDACFDQVFVPPDEICLRCGRLKRSGWPGPDCAECHDETYGFIRARSLYPYEGAARNLFLASKFTVSKRKLNYRLSSAAVQKRIAGKDSAEFFNSKGLAFDFAVEVPVFRPRWSALARLPMFSPPPNDEKKRKGGNTRSFNTAAVFAFYAAQSLKVPYLSGVLRKISDIPSQVGLSHTARRANVKGAFDVPSWYARRVKGATVLLCDDLITTGSTASECSRALKRAGAKSVYLLTLFSTTKRPETPDAQLPDWYGPDDLEIPAPIEFD
ncbi:MAG: ComF family protein [bacterium]|jgi:predicted amidophosphoribosyltransferase